MENILEIIVLGGNSGKGESIIVRTYDQIIIIDSFIDHQSGDPAPIAFLNSISEDINKVKLVIASHWHDDHIRGLDSILNLCSNAELVISDALTVDEFQTLVYNEYKKPIENTSMTTFHNLLLGISKSGKPPIYAIQDRSIYTFSDGSELWSISPSDQTVHDSRLELVKLLEDYGDQSTSIPSNLGNHYSIVLLIKSHNKNTVLGGDLEISKSPKKGWDAVVNLSKLKSIDEINVFKVPHHGSRTSYSDEVSKKLNVSSLIAISAYSNSSLPKSEMIEKYAGHSQNLYLTFCKKNGATSRTVGRIADKIIENNKRIRFNKGNRTYNGIVFDLNKNSVRLCNQATHFKDCP